MDIVFIRDLRLDTRIGAYETERRKVQTLQFELELGREAALHVGNGAWFVLAEAGDHDPPDRVVGVSVAGRVEPELVVAQTR